MKIAISDIETERVYMPETIWLFGAKEYDTDTGETTIREFQPWKGKSQVDDAIAWAETIDKWVGHRFISFDAIQINRLLKPKLIDLSSVIDTLVVSRLRQFDIPIPKGAKSAHSLEAWGIRLGLHKGSFSLFGKYSEEMREYWLQDLNVQEALWKEFKPFIYDPSNAKALRVEHDYQIELERQKYYGFPFDKNKAESLLVSVKSRMDTLEAEIEKDYPPKLEVVKNYKYKLKKDGNEPQTILNAREKYPLVKVDGDIMLAYEYVPFKPSSSQDRIEVLWEAGWKPFDKTKSHQAFGRVKVGKPYGKSISKLTQEDYDKKKAHFEFYGWKCNEDNLKTLPDTAPNGAKKLAEWLTLEGRRSSLVEWIGQVKEDGCIHGSTEGIGAWTHRAAHNNPNTANISSPWNPKNEPRSPVEKIKKEFDTDMRALWTVKEGEWLVGVDAEGIQLRILGDLIWRHIGPRDYADTIVNGDKDLETDIHNVNKRALKLNHLTRDDAKTFECRGL